MKNSSYILFITLCYFLISISKCQYSSFIIDLDANQQRCIIEYYKIKTVIIFEVTSDNKDILAEIRSPNGRIIYHNINSTNTYSFTSQNDGFFNFCIQNYGRVNSEVNIIIKSGIGANDYSSVAKSKDLEPIDYELDKILEKEKILNHFIRLSQKKENRFELTYKSIYDRIILCSIILIVGMIIIGVIETLYLKRFMEKRKII